jgi:hypothetical protein
MGSNAISTNIGPYKAMGGKTPAKLTQQCMANHPNEFSDSQSDRS